jgi:hypothetical protein
MTDLETLYGMGCTISILASLFGAEHIYGKYLKPKVQSNPKMLKYLNTFEEKAGLPKTLPLDERISK